MHCSKSWINPQNAIDRDVVILGRQVRKKPFIEVLVDVCMCACKKKNYFILPWTTAIIFKVNWTVAIEK